MCKCSIIFVDHKIPPEILQLISRELRTVTAGIDSAFKLMGEPVLGDNVLIINTDLCLVVLQVVDIAIQVQFQAPALVESTTTCPCGDQFDIFENILRAEALDVFSLRVCNGKGVVSEKSGKRPIKVELVNQMDALLQELCSCRGSCVKAIAQFDVEKTNTASAIGAGVSLTDQSWVQQVYENRAKYQDALRLIGILENKLGVNKLEATGLSASASGGNVTNDAALPAIVARAPRPEITCTLAMLFEVFSDHLRPGDWALVRAALSDHIPAEVLSNLPDGVAVFNELANKDFVSQENLSLLRSLFYDIHRVDLVHLTDCFAEGDYSLVLANSGARYTIPYVSEDMTSVPVQEIQRLSIEAEESESDGSDGEVQGDGGGGGVSVVIAERLPNLDEVEPAGEVARTEGVHFSCNHYDRYCDVQFSCSDRFWPCHRCHNASCDCGRTNLRSRDIERIKCKQCATVQQFPKENPNCEQCNLKFADYFCAICQHLTGTQSHPYHCDKCALCRLHGNSSFHCDDCGVCLHVSLRGNHVCRPDHECCICFEDVFSGCQILPCGHKVHKDCAATMLRNGVTRCPICHESFAHRIERRRVAR